MENTFCFTLKCLFVFKIFKFCSDFFSYMEKQFDKNIKDTDFTKPTIAMKLLHSLYFFLSVSVERIAF